MTTEKENYLEQVYTWINSTQFVENFVKLDEDGNEWLDDNHHKVEKYCIILVGFF